MPFVAECTLCRQKVRLPDRSVGASVACPRCRSYFTAAPQHEVIPAGKRPEPAQPAQPAPLPVATAVTTVQSVAPPVQPATETQEAPPAALPDAPPPRLLIPVDMP